MKSKQNTLLKRVLIIGFVISMAILACNLPRGSEADDATPTTENQDSVLAINQTLVVVTDVATLRAGPGVNFEVLGSLARDEVVNANGMSSNGDWYRILLENSINGKSIAWISTDFVEEMDFLPETSVPTVVFTATDTIEFSDALLPSLTPLDPLDEVVMITANVDTNCRAGTGPSFQILGALTEGMSVPVRGRSPDGGWYYIENPQKPGTYCWVWGQTTMIVGDMNQVPTRIPPPTDVPTRTSKPPKPDPTDTLIPIDTPPPPNTPTSQVTAQPQVDTPVPTQ